MKKTTKNYSLILMFALVFSIAFNTQAQKKPASPLKTVNASINDKDVTIVYSAPYKKEREIFGGLVPYDKVWRTGANNATTIEVSADVMIGGNKLAKGIYGLFTIPNEDKWTIIINSDAKQWGSYGYKDSKDIFRFDVIPSSAPQTEQFDISISDGMITLVWDTTKVSFEIK